MIKNVLLYFVRILGTTELSLLASIGAIILGRFASGDASFESASAFCAAFPTMLLGLYLLARREGYEQRKAFSLSNAAEYTIAFAIQFAIALIFKFAVYTSGPVYYAAAYIWSANGHDASRIGSVPTWIYLLCMLIADGIYLSVSIFGMNSGHKKRLEEAERLISGKN